jgi:hypothetical protein
MTPQFWCTWEAADATPMPLALAQRYADMGVTCIRAAMSFPILYAQPDQPINWQYADDTIGAITATGMDVYFDLNDFPAWMTDGLPMGTELPEGWPTRKGTGVEYAHVDTPTVHDFAVQIGQRYGLPLDKPKVKYFSIGNEPDFNNPITLRIPTLYGGSWESAMQWFFDETYLPFTRGIRSVIPSATLIAYECMTAGFTNSFLLAERRARAADPSLGRVADIVSYHGYAMDGRFPGDALKRLTGPGSYAAYFAQDNTLEGRAELIGEVGLEHGEDALTTVPVYWDAVAALNRHFAVTWRIRDSLVGPGPTYEPTPLYRVMQTKLLGSDGARHRAVAT